MRSFLEVCEDGLDARATSCQEAVYTTGDQSLAEAMWMGKALRVSEVTWIKRQVPCVKPDAKAQEPSSLVKWSSGAAVAPGPSGEAERCDGARHCFEASNVAHAAWQCPTWGWSSGSWSRRSLRDRPPCFR